MKKKPQIFTRTLSYEETDLRLWGPVLNKIINAEGNPLPLTGEDSTILFWFLADWYSQMTGSFGEMVEAKVGYKRSMNI